MKQPGLDDRHRDKVGKIRQKSGNTLISTLRKEYGEGRLWPPWRLMTCVQKLALECFASLAMTTTTLSLNRSRGRTGTYLVAS